MIIMNKTIEYCTILILFFAIQCVYAGSWSTSGSGDLSCTPVIIPAGARYVTFDLDIDDSEDDDFDLWVYFPTRTDCSSEDCRPSRGGGWDETCGPYNPFDYDPTSTCGGANETWRVKVTEENITTWGWDLDVTWVDCNVGNDCSTPFVINIPEDMTFIDEHNWTTGRGNSYSSTCLGTFDGGEDHVYRLVIDRTITNMILTLNPRGTANTGFCISSSCTDFSSCIDFSTNAASSEHSITIPSISAGTYYVLVDCSSGSIPDFDLTINSPIDCSNPVGITLNSSVLPVILSNRFTCGRSNNYESTCMGLMVLFVWIPFDTGEDIIYELTVTEDINVDITLDPGGLLDGTPGTGFLLANSCGDFSSCIDFSCNLMPGVHGIYNIALTSGNTYYIMVDTDGESATGIPDYTLTIGEASAGADCTNPIIVNLPGDLPYYDTDQTTCNMNDDYWNTCLGGSDEAQDVLYQLNISSDVTVDISLEPFGLFFLMDGTGFAIDDVCPPGGSCLHSSTGDSDDEHALYNVPLYASVGTYYLMVDGDPNFFSDCYDYNLSITEGTPVADPPNPTTTTNPCGNQTLTRVGSLPADVTWYWQGTSCGTRTDLGSGANYIATSSGTYCIRARHNISGIWSDGCGSVAVTVNPYPEPPTSAQSDRDNFCADDAGNISLSASEGSGTTMRWFSGSCGGTEIGTGSPLLIESPTTTTNYYIRWENSCGNSTCASVTVTVYNPQPVGTWTGYLNNDWSNAQNWGQCTLPTATTDVTIPAAPAYGRFPNVDTDDGTCVCRDITIDGTLSGLSGNLFVYGNWVDNGTFNCGTGTVTWVGTDIRAIGGTSNTTFFNQVTQNTVNPIDIDIDISTGEVDITTPGNEGLDLRGTEEIDITD